MSNPQPKRLKTPSARQRKAANLISENIIADKPRSVGAILQEAGYSKSTALRSTQVTRAEGFLAVLEQAGITDDKLAQVLNDGLTASKAVVMGVKSEESFVDVQPDYAVRHKYLETGLRLKGHGKVDGGVNVNFNNFAQDFRQKYPIDAT